MKLRVIQDKAGFLVPWLLDDCFVMDWLFGCLRWGGALQVSRQSPGGQSRVYIIGGERKDSPTHQTARVRSLLYPKLRIPARYSIFWDLWWRLLLLKYFSQSYCCKYRLLYLSLLWIKNKRLLIGIWVYYPSVRPHYHHHHRLTTRKSYNPPLPPSSP